MLGRSITFGPKTAEKLPKQGNFFELTTSNKQYANPRKNAKFYALHSGKLKIFKTFKNYIIFKQIKLNFNYIIY